MELLSAQTLLLMAPTKWLIFFFLWKCPSQRHCYCMHPLYYNGRFCIKVSYYNKNIFSLFYIKCVQHTQQNNNFVYKILNEIKISLSILHAESWFYWVFFRLKKMQRNHDHVCSQHNRVIILLHPKTEERKGEEGRVVEFELRSKDVFSIGF